MRFVKVHGLGNDYVLVDTFRQDVENPSELSRAVSDRHLGVGSDGLILVGPSSVAAARMRIFNADGSEAEMCGNGIRCVAKYCRERGLADGDEVAIETGAGVKTLQLTMADGRVEAVRVNMGKPSLRREAIPMKGPPDDRVADEPLKVGERTLRCTCVNMGNPHCVIFVDDLDKAPVGELGPLIENHPDFPMRTNVHFAQTQGRDKVRMATWERGSGRTLACGTGACAVGVAAAITGRANREIEALQPGGSLRIEFARDQFVYMTGPASFVFEGEWPDGGAGCGV